MFKQQHLHILDTLPAQFSNFYEQISVFDDANLRHRLIKGQPYRPTRASILFLRKGSIVIQEDITELHLCDNAIFLLDPYHVYEIKEISKEIELKFIGFDRQLVESPSFKLNRIKVFQTLKSKRLSLFSTTIQEMELFYQNIKLLAHYIEHQQDLQFSLPIIENYFNIIMYGVISIASPQLELHSKQMSSQEKLAYDFFILVSQYYLTNKPVSFYAQELHITIRHLSTTVKQVSGKTPSQIIAAFLVNEAKVQLSDPTLSVSLIAQHLNFSDQYAFTHFFKRHTTMSPTHYRAKTTS